MTSPMKETTRISNPPPSLNNDDEFDDDCFSESSYEPDADDDVLPQVWRCEFCKKVFKSEPQFDNHLKSRKHNDLIKKLKVSKIRNLHDS